MIAETSWSDTAFQVTELNSTHDANVLTHYGRKSSRRKPVALHRLTSFWNCSELLCFHLFYATAFAIVKPTPTRRTESFLYNLEATVPKSHAITTETTMASSFRVLWRRLARRNVTDTPSFDHQPGGAKSPRKRLKSTLEVNVCNLVALDSWAVLALSGRVWETHMYLPVRVTMECTPTQLADRDRTCKEILKFTLVLPFSSLHEVTVASPCFLGVMSPAQV
jgi:hypothetical protein